MPEVAEEGCGVCIAAGSKASRANGNSANNTERNQVAGRALLIAGAVAIGSGGLGAHSDRIPGILLWATSASAPPSPRLGLWGQADCRSSPLVGRILVGGASTRPKRAGQFGEYQ